MSADMPFTRDKLDFYLRELAKEFRKLNGTAMPAELILIGGASILANYGFREMTYDMDAIISATSVMKEAVNRVGDKFGLPNGWLNEEARHTRSYSGKLFEVSIYYRTFSNVLTVRTVAGAYLVAMKLMSGRKYKNDISDIVGILWEHQKCGKPITMEAVDKAITTLYGGWDTVPEDSRTFIMATIKNGDYEAIYHQSRTQEVDTRDILLEFGKDYPDALKEDSIDSVIESVRRKKQQTEEER